VTTRQSLTRGQKSDESFTRAERLGRLYLSILLGCAILVVLVPSVFFAENSRIFLLKIIAIALLSLMPGWLYLQFLRNKGPSLYDEYVLNLFRLHIDEYRNLPAPPQHTSYYVLWKKEHDELKDETKVETKANLYRRKFESVYGKSSVSTLALIKDRQSLRDRTETFSPVLMATLLLCLGWVLVLQPDLYRAVDLIGGTPLSGRPRLPFEPLQFGFLGAYAFILQDLIHRYFRDDLKTGAYISAATRIVFVAVIVTTVDLLWSNTALEQEKIFAFFVGFFPQIGLQALQAAVAKPLRRLIPSLRNDYPLSQIEGLNIWYEARFVEEGIEDMQNLVSASLVDLMLRMRVPISRLADWIDQAYLCLHLPKSAAQGQPPPALTELRRLGIRTATDFERVWKSQHSDHGTRVLLAKAFGVSEQDAPSVVRSVLKTFNGEPNLWHVREFTNHEWLLRDRHRMPKMDGLTPVPTPSDEVVVDLTKTPSTG
jgi:hypothetical protein